MKLKLKALMVVARYVVALVVVIGVIFYGFTLFQGKFLIGLGIGWFLCTIYAIYRDALEDLERKEKWENDMERGIKENIAKVRNLVEKGEV